ncbi:MAG: GTPase [Planctomycetota bacterium]
MPANLTPQYFDAEERYRKAATDPERLAALQEMLQTIPKHKGTEKLQADLKKKIKVLKSGGPKKKGGSRAPMHTVERSGTAQIALVGAPNSGKSRFVRDLTSADPEVADYPFTTRTPTPGIALAEQIPLQLVDLPPITGDWVEPWLIDLVRNADMLLVVLDLGSDEVLDHWEQLLAALERFHVSIDAAPPAGEREIGTRYHLAAIAGNKMDVPGAPERLEILRDLTDDRPILTCSLDTGHGVAAILADIVRQLDVIRVYTKIPGKPADLEEPFVLPRGTTVEGAARTIHKELAANLSFARGYGGRFRDGQPIGRDLVLEDGDILEFHE